MNFLDALDNDELALLQTLLNDKIPPLFDLLVIADHHDVTAGLIELHRRLRYQKGCLRSAPIDNHVDDAAWDKQAFRIWQLCADQDGVRVGLDLNVEEISAPGMRIHAAVGQLDVNSHMRVLVGRGSDSVLIFDYVGLAGLKCNIDRVLTDDRRQGAG